MPLTNEQIEAERVKFEREISASPFENDITRWPCSSNSPWPGNYRNIDVDLAWCMWSKRAELAQSECVTQPQGAQPVAWVEVIDRDGGPYEFHGIKLLPKGRHQLYTAPQPSAADKAEMIGLANALERQEQLDEDGVTVGVSREACCLAAELLRKMVGKI